MKPLIGYVRVSTDKQGKSGLGLEAQQAAIYAHSQTAGHVEKLYVEVESGKKVTNRPKLKAAIAHARRLSATLVIAKLDRLARNVAFVSALMESDIEFVACDNPHANRLTLHILAAVAEDEARRISQRTKDALAAYKARGGLLGGARPECRNLTPEARQAGAIAAAQARRATAASDRAELRPIVRAMRNVGSSYEEIAAALQAQGHKIGRECVRRIIKETANA